MEALELVEREGYWSCGKIKVCDDGLRDFFEFPVGVEKVWLTPVKRPTANDLPFMGVEVFEADFRMKAGGWLPYFLYPRFGEYLKMAEKSGFKALRVEY